MHFSQVVLLVLASLTQSGVSAQGDGDRRGGNNNSAGVAATTDNASTATTTAEGEVKTLIPNLAQPASNSKGDANAEAGQSDSATDDSNFINFCAGSLTTNGKQVQGGSCNGIVMGKIPSTANMISTIITSPRLGQVIAPNTAFTINVQVQNLVAGRFTNPATTYYAAPQDLIGGKVVGHTHVTVQDLGGDIFTQNPPDATKFAFFKGINDVGNGNGALSAAVAGGLPEGVYRVCSLTSASNHQPVLMPVAQRGAQDDCSKFIISNNPDAFLEAIGAGNAANNNNNNNNNQGNNNNNQGNNNNNQGNNSNNQGSNNQGNNNNSGSAGSQANGGTAAATGNSVGSNNNNNGAGTKAESGSSSASTGAASSTSSASTSAAGNGAAGNGDVGSGAAGSGAPASSATSAAVSNPQSTPSGNGANGNETTGNGRNGHGGRHGGRRHRKYFAKNFVA